MTFRVDSLMCNFCGDSFEPLFGVGQYVKHLIKEHWDILEKLHNEQDKWT